MSVYRCTLGDCTNGGISGRKDVFEVYFKYERVHHTQNAIGFSLREAQEVAPNIDRDDMIIVEDWCCDMTRLRAIPAGLIIDRKWVMMGGNFIYTCDSRGFHNPIPIHDRVES